MWLAEILPIGKVRSVIRPERDGIAVTEDSLTADS
jgi:hypothetical protein